MLGTLDDVRRQVLKAQRDGVDRERFRADWLPADCGSTADWERAINKLHAVQRDGPRLARPLRRAAAGDAAERRAGHQPGAAGVVVVVEPADDLAGGEEAGDRRGRTCPRPRPSLVIFSPPKVKVMPVVTP